MPDTQFSWICTIFKISVQFSSICIDRHAYAYVWIYGDIYVQKHSLSLSLQDVTGGSRLEKSQWLGGDCKQTDPDRECMRACRAVNVKHASKGASGREFEMFWKVTQLDRHVCKVCLWHRIVCMGGAIDMMWLYWLRTDGLFCKLLKTKKVGA